MSNVTRSEPSGEAHAPRRGPGAPPGGLCEAKHLQEGSEGLPQTRALRHEHLTSSVTCRGRVAEVGFF